jgi:hypothetical protein
MPPANSRQALGLGGCQKTSIVWQIPSSGQQARGRHYAMQWNLGKAFFPRVSAWERRRLMMRWLYATAFCVALVGTVAFLMMRLSRSSGLAGRSGSPADGQRLLDIVEGRK